MSGFTSDAIRFLNIVVNARPNFSKAINNLACATSGRDLEEALGYAYRAYQLNPHSDIYPQNVITLLVASGRQEDAKRFWHTHTHTHTHTHKDTNPNHSHDCVWEFAVTE
eukprot:GHVR01098939.1.p1 GENE.GHVR01098939.1~~GHVR01098939.1.p1  ORF type:complete len:110 (+),score=42.96 GHVR01098939.1:84-413(+)